MKTLLINEKNDNIEYVIKSKRTDDRTKRVIKASKSDVWTEHTKGKKFGTLVDHGNGITLKLGNNKLDIDYGDFCELYHLMTEHVNEENNLMGGYKRIKTKK